MVLFLFIPIKSRYFPCKVSNLKKFRNFATLIMDLYRFYHYAFMCETASVRFRDCASAVTIVPNTAPGVSLWKSEVAAVSSGYCNLGGSYRISTSLRACVKLRACVCVCLH